MNQLNTALNILLHTTAIVAAGLALSHLVRRQGALVRCLLLRVTLVGVAIIFLLDGAAGIRPFFRPAISVLGGEAPSQLWVARQTAIVVPTADQRRSHRSRQPKVSQIGGKRTRALASPNGSNNIIDPHDAMVTQSLPLRQLLIGRALDRIGLVITIVWFAGSLAALAWLSYCLLVLRRILASAESVTHHSLVQLLPQLAQEHGLPAPRLLSSTRTGGPLLVGLMRPAILLPANFQENFSSDEQRAVLLHELTHLKRGDLKWNLLHRVCSALIWPQFLLRVLGKQLQLQQEEICDRAVLDGGCQPTLYADSLLRLAEKFEMAPAERAWGAGVVPFRSSLGRRVLRIMDRSSWGLPRVPPVVRVLSATAMLASAGLLVRAAAIQAGPGVLGEVAIAGPYRGEAENISMHLNRRALATLTQTVRGVTVNLRDPRWVQEGPWDEMNGMSDNTRLRIGYDVDGPISQRPDFMSRTALDIEGPDEQGPSGWSADQSAFTWSGLDPRWPNIGINMELADANAPIGANGTFENTLHFGPADLPTKVGQIVLLNQTRITPKGTRVTLEKVGLTSEFHRQLEFVVHFQTPATIPDLHTSVRFDMSRILDDTRSADTGRFSILSSGDSLSHLPDRNSLIMTSEDQELPTHIRGLELRLDESAPSLRQMRWLRQFHFDLPLRQVPIDFKTSARMPVSLAKSSGLTAELETLKVQSNAPNPGWELKSRLWTQATEASRIRAGWYWKLISTTLHDQQGNQYDELGDQNAEALLWRGAGRPVQPGERGEMVGFWEVGDTPPTKVSLEAKLRAQRQTRVKVDAGRFKVSAVPAAAGSTRKFDLPSGAYLLLRGPGTLPTPVEGAPGQAGQNNDVQFGVICSYVPPPGQDLAGDITIEPTDSLGRSLKKTGLTRSNDTFYFRAPAPGIDTIHLIARVTETYSGEEKTVVFLNLTPTNRP